MHTTFLPPNFGQMERMAEEHRALVAKIEQDHARKMQEALDKQAVRLKREGEEATATVLSLIHI